MQIKCPKCGEEQTEDLSFFADEFSLSMTVCETCNSDLGFDENGHVFFISKYAPISVAVDVILKNEKNEILFVQRKYPPEMGKLALPGGFVEPYENCASAAVREILEETHLQIDARKLRIANVMSEPARDPRGRVISIVYEYTVPITGHPVAADDADSVQWVNTDDLRARRLNIAFDHYRMIT